MAVNVNRSFKTYGWCTRIRGIESGGAVEGLPTHTFPTDDGGVDDEVPDRDRDQRPARGRAGQERLHAAGPPQELRLRGLHRRPVAAEAGTSTTIPDATANANLAARLPYLFACSRFAHYLKCIVRDKLGSFKERGDMERWLNDWIMNYVDGDPGELVGEHQGEEAPGRRRGDRRGSARQSGLLHVASCSCGRTISSKG